MPMAYLRIFSGGMRAGGDIDLESLFMIELYLPRLSFIRRFMQMPKLLQVIIFSIVKPQDMLQIAYMLAT